MVRFAATLRCCVVLVTMLGNRPEGTRSALQKRRRSGLGWFLVVVLVTMAPIAGGNGAVAQEGGYRVVELGPVEPALPVIASGINGEGAVIAWARSNDGFTTAFLARDGTEFQILSPDEGVGAALDINAGRTVVGWMSFRDAASGEYSSIQAVRWQKGEAVELGHLGGDESVAFGVNDKGHVVGWAETADGRHAFLWARGEMTDLGTLGGNDSTAFEISTNGLIAGDATTEPGQTHGETGTHAFLWDEGTLTDLGTLGGDLSRAFGVNDAGQVVGWSTVGDAGDVTRAYLWDEGEMIDLGSLPGIADSSALDINSSGQIVGIAGEAGITFDGSTAVLWDEGEIVDLNARIPADGGTRLAQAGSINDAGQIVCTGFTADGSRHVFVLTPVTA